ncbi:CsbD family protein [Microbacterium sp. M3]|uniref:CsbD family protein n=1 Tax=Microbacterium arthrosphaerae TaxID=792652 RepID=A0ABU4H4E5_9MICO|nr:MULTISPECIES: CsbD family protein [Microbacterium]MDW4574213.1 CsbD family protein [Microbacterium arthrosphaerae]MDW7608068.1 CsbD family protein [Microbacterium sp. M3]
MGMGDDIKHNMEDMKGKVKEGIGDATDNERLEAEGKADQVGANLKKAGDDVKDAFTDDR